MKALLSLLVAGFLTGVLVPCYASDVPREAISAERSHLQGKIRGAERVVADSTSKSVKKSKEKELSHLREKMRLLNDDADEYFRQERKKGHTFKGYTRMEHGIIGPDNQYCPERKHGYECPNGVKVRK